MPEVSSGFSITVIAIFASFVGWFSWTLGHQDLTDPYIQTVVIRPKKVVAANQRMDVSTWQAYTNNKYGFSILHPKELKVSDEAGMVPGVTIGALTIAYYENVNAVSSGTTVTPRKTVYDLMADPNFTEQKKTPTASGDEAFTAVFTNKVVGGSWQNLFISHAGHIYELGYDLDSSPLEVAITKQMITTLKFTK